MRNEICGNIIIDPSVELVPSIHIPPMTNAVLDYKEPTCDQIEACTQYLRKRFGIHYLVSKARSALRVALEYYNLRQDDVVTILTTSGNFYVSSCVTKVIENICQWNREVTDKTKVLLVIHEFGYPYANLQNLKKYHLPIIEDCAYAFFSQNEEVGKVGDFAVYSLPKAFPVQLGGVLCSNIGCIPYDEDARVKEYVLNRISPAILQVNDISATRIKNWYKLSVGLQVLGAKPYPFKQGECPGVMLFEWGSEINYPKLKEFMQYHGVESSVFYGRNAFFIPTHHLLTDDEINYMLSLLSYFKDYENV